MKKVILITGCSSGFGYLTTKLLSSKGHFVYAGVRQEKDLELFNDTNVKPVLLDITWSQGKINNVVNKIFEKEGKIDVLVNNAGFGFLGTVGSFTVEEVKEQFETNFFGQLKMIKSVLPFMRKEKKGLIINISSISGLFTSAFYGVYSSSKFALEALTTALRNEEEINGIKVVSVNPSSHETKFWQNTKIPNESNPMNNQIRMTINKLAKFRRDPINVVKVIEKIIDTGSPKKNYLVGPEAYLLYYASRIFPDWLIEFVTSLVIKKITSVSF